MFDLSVPKLLVLAVIALVIFGPNELPKIATQIGRALRDLRRIAEGAKSDLREGLGPQFADLEIEDLNPKRFVQKHLSGDLDADQGAQRSPRVNTKQCDRISKGTNHGRRLSPASGAVPGHGRGHHATTGNDG